MTFRRRCRLALIRCGQWPLRRQYGWQHGARQKGYSSVIQKRISGGEETRARCCQCEIKAVGRSMCRRQSEPLTYSI